MELIQDAQNARQVRQAMRLVSPFPVIWPSEADCQRALDDFQTYHLSHGLGLLDALIAACAVEASKKLCTFNVKHHLVISGLELAQPYAKKRPSIATAIRLQTRHLRHAPLNLFQL